MKKKRKPRKKYSSVNKGRAEPYENHQMVFKHEYETAL